MFLLEIVQKVKFGGIIGCSDSDLEVVFFLFEILKLNSDLHDTAETVLARSGRGRDYC